MSKKRVSGLISLFALSITALLVLTGYPWHTASLYGLKVAGDNSGGAIAVYEESLGGGIYAQKISPDGNKMWGEKGVPLGSSCDRFYSFHFIQVIYNGSGGAVIIWPEVTSPKPPITSIYHVKNLNSDGHTVWQMDFERVDRLIEGGSGGVIINGSTDGKNQVLVKIDSEGNSPWGRDGVSLKNPGNTRQIAGDGLVSCLIINLNN